MTDNSRQTTRFYASSWSAPICGGAVLLGSLFLIGGYFVPEYRVITTTMIVVLIIIVMLFGRLSVVVTDDYIIISYGPGVVRRILEVHALADSHVVANGFLSALYNVRAESVLKAYDRFGRTAVIPLVEPRALLNFLRARQRR